MSKFTYMFGCKKSFAFWAVCCSRAGVKQSENPALGIKCSHSFQKSEQVMNMQVDVMTVGTVW